MRMIGIDVGGTFTDIVFYDEQHNELRWRRRHRRRQPRCGRWRDRAQRCRSSRARSVRSWSYHRNERDTRAERGPVWLITTRGFKDTPELARTNRTVLYDIKTLEAPSISRPPDIIEIDERIRRVRRRSAPDGRRADHRSSATVARRTCPPPWSFVSPQPTP